MCVDMSRCVFGCVFFALHDKVPHWNSIHVQSNRKITIKIMRGITVEKSLSREWTENWQTKNVCKNNDDKKENKERLKKKGGSSGINRIKKRNQHGEGFVGVSIFVRALGCTMWRGILGKMKHKEDNLLYYGKQMESNRQFDRG